VNPKKRLGKEDMNRKGGRKERPWEKVGETMERKEKNEKDSGRTGKIVVGRGKRWGMSRIRKTGGRFWGPSIRVGKGKKSRLSPLTDACLRNEGKIPLSKSIPEEKRRRS